MKERNLTQLYHPLPLGKTIDPEWTLDRAVLLKRFVKSILLNFLELVGILAVNPTDFAPKIERLIPLFYNSHALINDYRPHQARETLIMMMEEQIAKKEVEVKGVNQIRGKVEDILAGFGVDDSVSVMFTTTEEKDAKERRKLAHEKQQRLWQLMDEDFL